ncbi:MAG: multiple sugar transport system permease protein [Thermoanaerobacteraceae bacterium]|nr:multiple sugar transport system permease protein [Thermoanaerobacteraceae bacterium]MDN5301398.1 multiple sugar transport system permease protein [Thermoanaerobacteraceae bacterium]MDN5313063.1 multiple sugar transport system permease protein [Thermoanaerobacteraceae bacterium]
MVEKKYGRGYKRIIYCSYLYILLIIFGIAFMVPIIWMLSTSLKTPADIYQHHPKIIPSRLEWRNYIDAVTSIPYFKYVWNTTVISFFSVAGQLFAAPLVAYSISKIKWPGSKIVFALIISTMFLPYQVTMIPVYMIYYKLGLVGTFVPLILPNFFGYAFYIFLLRQFIITIPDSLIEAAKIDGASEFRIYWQIILPLIKPALTTVAVFTFLGSWSDFLGPLIYLNEENMYTLSLGLRQFLTEHSIAWGPLMAATTIFIIPTIIIFFLAQKQFIEGISTTGNK